MHCALNTRLYSALHGHATNGNSPGAGLFLTQRAMYCGKKTMTITMPMENAEEKVVFAVFISQYHSILWVFFKFSLINRDTEKSRGIFKITRFVSKSENHAVNTEIAFYSGA